MDEGTLLQRRALPRHAAERRLRCAGSCCRARVSRFIAHYIALARTFGGRFLAYLVVSQHVIKGFVGGGGGQGLMGTPISWIFKEAGGVSASRMQTLKAVALAPSALKGVVGVLSDLVPIFGWHRAPYMLGLVAVATPAFIILALVPGLSPELMTLCLAIGFTFVYGVDLLSEAAYATRIREQGPEQGPALVSFVWNGVFIHTLVATVLASLVIIFLGPRAVYLFCVAPSLVLLAVVLPNWHGETRNEVRGAGGAFSRTTTAEAKMTPALRGVVLTAITLTLSTIALMVVGTVCKRARVNLLVALALCPVVLGAVALLLPPPMARVCAYLFIQSCCTISIESGTFFFFTDNELMYADGPHLSVAFYTVFVGCVALACNVVGTALYGACMKSWNYHRTFTVAIVAFCIANLLSVVVLKRWNLAASIPDRVFVFGADAIQSTVAAWTWMPSIVLISQICPSGLEATTYSVASSCWNLGSIVAQFAGAALLESLGVRPEGKTGEGAQFDRLWIAAIVVSLAPLLSLLTLPCLIPDQRQDERLRLTEFNKRGGCSLPCGFYSLCCARRGGRAAKATACRRGGSGAGGASAAAEAEAEEEEEHLLERDEEDHLRERERDVTSAERIASGHARAAHLAAAAAYSTARDQAIADLDGGFSDGERDSDVELEI